MSKLDKLRALMAEHSIECYIVPHGDSHNCEYLAPCDERIKFISGFSGSNGLCVITQTEARMWTDGRYYLAAQKQLEAGWTMMKMEADQISWFKWVEDHLQPGHTIGLDYTQYPASMFDLRFGPLQDRGFLVKKTVNLVDLVWSSERPSRPSNQVVPYPVKYAGLEAIEKYALVAQKMQKADFLLITALDQIAWLLNLRGSDIDFNPVFFSFALFKKDTSSVDLFVDEIHFQNEETKAYLQQINVTLKPYDSIDDALQVIVSSGLSIGVDTGRVNSHLQSFIKNNLVNLDNVLETIKAAKTATEQQGMQNANIRDCAAIMKYFAFLEQELKKPDHGLDEYSGARKVEALRTLGELYVGPSFDTISSIGPNGAVIHYKPSTESALKLNNDEIYLLDSGGQYLDGTTDITRTVHFGGSAPTQFQKDCYTRVLMGTLDLERIVWPADMGICGADMDILARKALWSAGLDYKHGTGHGVGTYLNVHEGPQGISRVNRTQLVEGMCVSDEPGFYKDGEFGIRIENVVVCVKHPEHEKHLAWKNLTVAPYCRELIEVSLLQQDLKDYINKHHERCLEALAPLLQDDPLALAYVTRQCEPL